MKRLTSIRSCEIVSNLKKGDEPLFDLEKMVQTLDEKRCIKDWCYIIHDKDTYTDEDEKANPSHRSGELKPEHVHLLLRFQKNQPQKLECVAGWFGIAENFVNKIRGKWEDACLYQIHRNAKDKYQYHPGEVTANFDYPGLLQKISSQTEAQDIVWKILNGEIREYNKTLKINNMLLVTYSRQINEAFKVRSEHLQATVKDRHTECIFITGEPSSGKTGLAKKIAREKGLDFCVGSGSNDVMDGYAQEPCLILDDVRPSIMGLSDLLKMLDNHTASTIKSRYKNKYLNCELIILTTVLDIDTFYRNVFSEHDEPVTQLKRRCGTYIKMDRDIISISVWDDLTMRYSTPVQYPNPIASQYLPEKRKTTADVRARVEKWLPFLEEDAREASGLLEAQGDVEDGSFHLERISDTEAVIAPPPFQEAISDGCFDKLMLFNEGGKTNG